MKDFHTQKFERVKSYFLILSLMPFMILLTLFKEVEKKSFVAP